MSHEPGRERHMTHKCEHCQSAMPGPGIYHEHHDEYWCQNCIDNEAEAAYDRQQERNLELPPESMREEQIRLWEEHKLLHRR